MTGRRPSEVPHVSVADLSSEAGTAPVERDEFVFALTPIQERIWRTCRTSPEDTTYNASFRWKMEGPLITDLVELSFQRIIDRHEILRTTFPCVNDEPIQVVAASFPFQISQVDLRSLPQDLRIAEVDRLCSNEACTPFAVESGPLLRVTLLQLEEEHFVLLLTLHHLVTDGWSVGIIMEEFKEVYAALAVGIEPSLPPLAIQFGDYVEWLRSFVESPALSSQVSYWKQSLEGYEPISLPTDMPRFSPESNASSIVSQMLPRELTNQLKAFAAADGATIFSTALAACMLLVQQLTGKDDIAIGSTLAGRIRPELEALLGVFINGVIFRNRIQTEHTFSQFAADVRTTVWEAFANQEVPFETVLSAIRPGKTYAEVFPKVNFMCQKEYARASTFCFEFAGIRMSTMPSKSQGALYDLNFFMVEREAGWRLSLEYRTQLYHPATAQLLLNHFKDILEAITVKPNRMLSEFPLLHLDLKAQSSESSNTELSEEQQHSSAVIQPPEAPADELYAMPASLAQQRFWMLSELAPDNTAFNMAICVRITGKLLENSLQQSLQELVNRHETLRTTFKSEAGQLLQVIRSSQTFSMQKQTADETLEATRESVIRHLVGEEAELPFDLATGPLFRAKLLRMAPEDHVLVLTIHHSLADGWSVKILLTELWANYEATLVKTHAALPPLEIQYSDFAEWQKHWLNSAEAQEHLDFWTTTLSGPLPIIEFPTDRPPANRPASHGAMETQLLPANLSESIKLQARSNNATAFALTMACFAAVLSRYSEQHDLIIGSPVANRRPETETIIGPFAGPFALRVDLSGDPTLAELLRRAQNVCMNALSHTELPFEVLAEKLNVRSVHGRNPLFQFYFFYQTAFLQPQQVCGLTITPLPSFSIGTPFEIQFGIVERSEGLRAQVEYNPDLYDQSSIRALMTYYVEVLNAMVTRPDQTLSQLPLPPRRWEQSSETQAAHGEMHVTPHTPVEEKLQAIWQLVLGQPNLRVCDNFFELGGNSLQAARMAAMVEREFGLRITLNSLLQFGTVAGLAKLIEQPQKINPAHHVVTIRSSGTRAPLYWIPGGRAISVLGLREVSLGLATDQPVYGLESRMPGEDEALPTVEERAQFYLQLIRNMQPKGPYFLIGYCTGGMVAFEMAQQLLAQGEQVGFLGMVQAGVPGFYSGRLTRLRSDLAKKRYFATLFTKFVVHRIFPSLPGVTRKDRQLNRDGVAALLSGWISSSAQLPEPTQSANENRMKQYRPQPYQGKACLYLAESCFESAGLSSNLDSRVGWSKFLLQGADIHRIPGDHYSILNGENAKVLAAALQSSLLAAVDFEVSLPSDRRPD